MKLTFRTIKGTTFNLDAEPTTTVGDLKAQLEASQPSMPKEQLKLVYKGKVLRGLVSLTAYITTISSCLLLLLPSLDDNTHVPPAPRSWLAKSPPAAPPPPSATLALSPRIPRSWRTTARPSASTAWTRAASWSSLCRRHQQQSPPRQPAQARPAPPSQQLLRCARAVAGGGGVKQDRLHAA